MHRIVFGFLFLAGVPVSAQAQFLSIGVTAGVPISDHSQNYGQGCLGASPPFSTFCGPNDYYVKPYAIGPNLVAHLPWHISVEGGMLYERFHQDVIHGLIVYRGGSANFGEQYGVSANGWLFPLQLKYTFAKRNLSPFVNAGATLRHLGPFDGSAIGLSDYYYLQLDPQPFPVQFQSGRNLDVAVTMGVGVRWRVAVFDISPEIRFLHWTSPYYQPAQNQAMLMLGVAFPAVR